MMPSCKEVSELVSQSLDRKLSLRERASVRLHLMMCHMCAAYRRQIEFMHDAVRRLGRQAQTQGTLSDEAKARIKKRIEERQ